MGKYGTYVDETHSLFKINSFIKNEWKKELEETFERLKNGQTNLTTKTELSYYKRHNH